MKIEIGIIYNCRNFINEACFPAVGNVKLQLTLGNEKITTNIPSAKDFEIADVSFLSQEFLDILKRIIKILRIFLWLFLIIYFFDFFWFFWFFQLNFLLFFLIYEKFSFQYLYQALDIENIITIIECLLAEKKVLFTTESSNSLLITYITESIFSLMYPFGWPYV